MYHKSYGDPAGDQKSDKNEQTSIQILKNIGFDVKFIPSTYRQRKEITERLLSTLIDGVPAFIVDSSCTMITEGFEGGYRYPDAKTSGALSECPLEDGVYEHPMNAWEYIIVNIFKAVERKSKPRHYEPVEVNAGFSFAS